MITIINEETEEFTQALEVETRREEEDFRDLMNDFEFVKELNKELSLKYQDFVDSLPRVEEVDFLLHDLNIKKIQAQTPEAKIQAEKRIFQLRRFRSAVVLLGKADESAKPMSYEELIK